jgi:hypothetical protein
MEAKNAMTADRGEGCTRWRASVAPQQLCMSASFSASTALGWLCPMESSNVNRV